MEQNKQVKEIRSAGSLIGDLITVNANPESIYVVRLPRNTDQLSNGYLSHISESLERLYPNLKFLLVGRDIDIAELSKDDILYGIISSEPVGVYVGPGLD